MPANIGSIICHIRAIPQAVSFSVTSLSFMISTLHRYMAIVHNRPNLWIFEKKRQPYVFFTMWIFALFVNIPSYVGEPYAVFWPDYCVIVNPPLAQYILMGFIIFIVVLPLVSIPFFYLHILIVIKRSSRKVEAMSALKEKKVRRGNRTALVLFLLYIAFMSMFGPYMVYNFIRDVFSDRQKMEAIFIIWLLFMSVSAFNPVLYIILFPEYRKCFKMIVCCKHTAVENLNPSVTQQVSTVA